MKLAPHFCQVAWVVADIEAAEQFFTNLIGIEQFLQVRDIDARETHGYFHGEPADWVFHLSIAYAGEMQVELIQPVSGDSIFRTSIEEHGNSVQHVAYWLDDSEFDEASAYLRQAGYMEVQSLQLDIGRVSYFDTTAAIGVYTEIVGATVVGHGLIRSLKAGTLQNPQP